MTDPIPLQGLILNGEEEAVWQAAFGAAFAQIALRYDPRIDDAPIAGIKATAQALTDNAAEITLEAQLIAQAAVLQYRKIARS